MRRITRDDAIKAVGAADDVVIAEIIGTGATIDELAAAQAWMANDEPLMNAGKPLPSGRVGELRVFERRPSFLMVELSIFDG